jgi:N-acetylneuraminic acid mutarotase
LNNIGYVGGGFGDNTNSSGQSYFNDLYAYDPVKESWVQVVSQGRKRGFASVFVINDKAYIFGGTNSSGVATDMWSYDGKSWTDDKSWVVKNETYNKSDDSFDDDYSTITRYQAATFVINGKGYVTCGSSGSSLLKNTWEYDPTTDRWTERSSFEKTPRYGAIGATTSTGVGIVVTGFNGSSYLDDGNLFYPTATSNKND